MNEFIIEGKAVPKGRPRKGKHGNLYTPQETRNYEEVVKWLYMAEKNKKFFQSDIPLFLLVETFIKRPKSVKREFPTVKPDVDNTSKTIMDALNMVAYTDDAQIVDLYIKKRYADRDYTRIKILDIKETEEAV